MGDGGHGGHGTAGNAPAPVDGAPEIAVEAIDIDYKPNAMLMAAGQPTNVTITNQGETLHDFTLAEAGVHVNIDPGTSETISVVVQEPGRYQAFCAVPGHADAGMIIDVTVQDPSLMPGAGRS